MKKIFISLFSLTLFLTGCSSLSYDNKDVKLTGKEYILVQESGIPNIIITFDEGNFYGFSGVNNYFGKYEKSGKNIKFDRMGATLMAGPEKLMTIEQEYFNDLNSVQKFYIDENDNLVLVQKNGDKLIFKENKKVD